MSVFLCVMTIITGVIFLIFLMVPFFGNSTPLYIHLAYIYESQTLFTSLSFVFLALIILLCFVIFKRKLKEEISSYNETLLKGKEETGEKIIKALDRLTSQSNEGMETISSAIENNTECTVNAIEKNNVDKDLTYIKKQLDAMHSIAAELAVKMENKSEESTDKEIKNLAVDIRERLLNLETMAKNTMDNL